MWETTVGDEHTIFTITNQDGTSILYVELFNETEIRIKLNTKEISKTISGTRQVHEWAFVAV